MTRLTVGEIDGKIADVDVEIAVLEQESQGLALDAVSGTQGASEALDRIRASIRALSDRRKVLADAREAAEQMQGEAWQAEQAVLREKHLGNARDTVALLLEKAKRFDELVASYQQLVPEFYDLEKSLRTSLNAAKQMPSDGFIGRANIAGIASNIMGKALNAPAFQVQRTLAATISTAWDHLLEQGNGD